MQKVSKALPDTSPTQFQVKLDEREHEIAMLKEISEVIVTELNFEKVLDIVAERARDLLDAETVLIPLLDENLEQYTYKAGCGKNVDEIVGESLPLDFGICGWVWRNKKAWWRGVLDELSDDEKNKWEKEAGTMLMVPLIGKEHFLGGIAGINKANKKDFNKRDLDLLSIFASQVSIAIENAKTYEKLENEKIRAEKYHSELIESNNKLVSANKALENLALYDHLTKIPNRSLIQDRLQQALLTAERDSTQVSILVLDLDHFKEVNDSLGHHVGDTVLIQVCDRLRRVLRQPDTLGRLGGDEFAVVIPNTSSEIASIIAGNLIKVFDEPFFLENQNFQMSTSIGIATYPGHGKDVTTLLKRADVAMYVAKRNKTGYSIYDSREDHYSSSRLSLLNELRKYVENNQMLICYQPIVEIKTSRIVGVEMLTRWPEEADENIEPEIFVPMMEQLGLICPFTDWALDKSLKQCAQCKKLGFDLTLSVNLSMYNLRDPEFPKKVFDLLDKWKIKASSLIFEITESAVMGNNKLIPKVLSILNNKGVQFSIDDFGTGYSSLIRLKKLKVNELKIDKSFVTSMLTDRDDEVIVRSTVDLGRNLGLRVVAEGVETSEVRDKLEEMGCKYFQGYLISEALDVTNLIEFIKNS